MAFLVGGSFCFGASVRQSSRETLGHRLPVLVLVNTAVSPLAKVMLVLRPHQ